MKANNIPSNRESSKQRALRIGLSYLARSDAFVRSKFFWAAVCSFLAVAYLGWIVVGSEPAVAQLSPAPLAAVHARSNGRCADCHLDYVPLGANSHGVSLLTSAFNGFQHSQTIDANKISQASCSSCHERHVVTPHNPNQRPDDVASCASCHAEHRGHAAQLTRPDDQSCTICHADIAAHQLRTDPTNPLPNVSHFACSSAANPPHPKFRSLPKTDDNQFKFNHQLHLRLGQWPNNSSESKGPWTLGRIAAELREQYQTSPGQPDTTAVQLDCASCHQPDRNGPSPQSGKYMQPVRFEQHCQACHPLDVASVASGKPLNLNIRHGLKQDEIREALFAGLVKHQAGETAQSLPHLSPNTPIPGKTPGNNLAQNLADQSQTIALQTKLYNDTCLKCHTEQEFPPKILHEPIDFPPPKFPDRWLLQARFDHGAHRDWAKCSDCHAAADAQPGEGKTQLDDSQVMIPNIDNCVQCHAPTSTHSHFRSSARFDCAECHRYHDHSAGKQ
ncbi:hypothetical protein ETAA8_36660 [Anatilimnocola aggregata]|uniref:Uncharacterized protein n=1 Tax=Anatilimnocola aggregata TaxID=2528021 RepID=A0A517YE91_9BACT|nr:hypothetical protein [Anatilimnocola aggregata]QDU28563.1 hypothetical protein ETAA8_36660 [Anatilimnocola aggregata]